MAGYSYNAIAEHPIIPEYDDNEEKWKWNGALTNLSDLSFSDYAKTIYVISGTTTGGSSVVENKINITYSKGESTYVLNANMQYVAPQNILIVLQLEGATATTNVAIPAGTMLVTANTNVSTAETAPDTHVISVTPQRDDYYKYSVVVPSAIEDHFNTYNGIYLQKNFESITEEEIATMSMNTVDANGVVLNYEISARDKQVITEEELINYKYALVLALPKEIYDSGKFYMVEHAFQSPHEFIKKKDIVLNDKNYTLLYRVSDGTQFVSRYMQAITYQFDIKYVNN